MAVQGSDSSLSFPEDIDTTLFSKKEVALPSGIGSPHAVASAIVMLASED